MLADDRYDFARALVRRSLYSRLAPSRRARVHRRLAEALERDGRPELAAEIARQYLASADLPGRRAASRFALTAAEAATAAGEPVAAARHLDLAAKLLEPGDSELRARILGDLALALAAAGHPAEATLALADAVDVHERVGTGGEEIAGLIAAVVAGVLDLMGSPLSLQPLIARGLAALGEQRGLPWARLKLLERPVEIVPAGPVRIARFAGLRSRGRPDHPRARHRDRRGACGRGGRAVAARPLRGLHAASCTAGATPGRACAACPAGDQRDRRPLGRLRAARRAPVRGDRGAGGPDGLAAGARDRRRAADRAARRARRARPGAGTARSRGGAASPSSGATIAPRRSSRSSPTSRSRTSSPTGPDVGERMEAFATRREPGPWAGQLWAAIGANAFARAGLDERARALLETITPVLAASSPWVEAQPGAVAFAAEAAWVLRAPELARPLLDPARAVVAAHARGLLHGQLGARDRPPARGARPRLAGGVRPRPSDAGGTRPARARARSPTTTTAWRAAAPGKPGPSRCSRRPPSGSRRSA